MLLVITVMDGRMLRTPRKSSEYLQRQFSSYIS